MGGTLISHEDGIIGLSNSQWFYARQKILINKIIYITLFTLHLHFLANSFDRINSNLHVDFLELMTCLPKYFSNFSLVMASKNSFKERHFCSSTNNLEFGR